MNKVRTWLSTIDQLVDKVVKWAILSSADPSKAALTVKGVLTGTIPYLLVVSGMTHWHTSNADLTAAVDIVTQIVTTILTLVASLMTTIGLVRKLMLTIDGGQTPLQS